ncbi:MAG: ABC transporter permease [Pseudomonadales bacterium]|jgi:sodium transport system permease protein
MHPITVVLGKEIRDARRDKRSVLSAFLFPIFAPVMVYFMLTAIIELRTDAEKITIPIQGGERAPVLIQWLQEKDVKATEFTGDARAVVKDKEEKVVLIIPENYQQRLSELRTVRIEVVSDSSRTDAQPVIARVYQLLREYNGEIASLRLITRGVSPEVMRVIVGENVDVASQQQRTAAALNFIPLYIIMAAFVAGMGIAVDSTAGERERKTLEPLLINPIERHYIVIGKWIAASLFSALGMVMTLILCVMAMLHVPLDQIGLQFSVSPVQVMLMIIATLPLALLATSMQLLLGMFAKSFKDAQSYIGFLILLPVVPSMYMMFNPVAMQDWMFAVPMLGQHLLLVEVLGGKSVPLIAYFYSALSCLVLGMAFVLITARLFKRESIING